MDDPQRTDSVLRVVVVTMLAALIALGGWLGFTVYRDRIAAEDANPALRTAKVIRAQVNQNPNDVVLRVRLGEALATSGKPQQAIEQFNAALKIDPKHTGALLDLGLVAAGSSRFDEARGYFKKVIDITGADPKAAVSDRRELAFYNLGRVEMYQKNWEAAIGNFKEALRIRNDASDTYFYLAQALAEIDQNDDAMSNLAIALKFDPSFAQAHYWLGKLYLEEGDKVRASAEAGKAMQLSPDAPEPEALAAQIGKPEEFAAQARALASTDASGAIQAAAIAFNLDPRGQVETGRLEAELLVQLGRKKSALTVYQALAAVVPNDAEVKAAIKKLTPKNAKPSGAGI